MIVFRRSWQVAASLVSAVGIFNAAQAVEWMDDFNDGSATDGAPLTWVENIGGFFPGAYDASSGDYVLTPVVDFSDDSTMSAFVPVEFTDVYIRTQGIVLPDPNDPVNNVGGNLVLTARIDPNTLSGYLLYFDVGGTLGLQILQFGAPIGIGVSFGASFNAGSEVNIELNIVGDQLSGFAWAADDPNGKPATPQATATDTTYTSGVAGIVYNEDDDNTAGVFRYVAARDTPFVDALQGDFDGDDDVDGGDFLIWQRGLGLTGQPDGSTGDANGDGDVDADDLGFWKTNFGGAQASAAIRAVPEPTTLALGAIGALALAMSGVKAKRVACRPA